MRFFKYVIFLLVFNICAKGKLVFLKGTGCAGKTSLCAELQKLDNTWKIVDEDQIFYETFPQNLSNIYPDEAREILKAVIDINLWHAIIRNQIFFTDTATYDEKKIATDNIRKIQRILDSKTKEIKAVREVWNSFLVSYIIKQIRDNLIVGNNVIVDHWFLKEEHIDELKKEFDVTTVLAYAPFNILVERTLKRNDESIKNQRFSQIRFFHQALMSFKDQYLLIPESEFANLELANGCIDKIDLQSAKNNLNTVEEKLVESEHADGSSNLSTRGEFTQKKFKEYKYEFLKNFQKEATCHVVPVVKYDVLLRTNEYTSVECAKILLES